MRDGGDIGIAQQRQNRVIKGSGRDLDLAARREIAVHRQHRRQRLALLGDHPLLIGERIIAPFADQLPQLFVLGENIFIEPCELAEDLQVPQILDRHRIPPAIVQLDIARIAPNHLSTLA